MNTASKRIGRLEVKSARGIEALAEEERRKKIETREQWRKDNRERLRWEMFLALWGPDSDWYTLNAEPEDPKAGSEVVAQIAYSEKFRDILKHYNGCFVDYSHMKGFDGAFAYAIEAFYGSISNYDLLTDYLSNYGSDLPSNTPYEDLAAMKIEGSGFEWLQIAYDDEQQRELEEQIFGEFLSENFML